MPRARNPCPSEAAKRRHRETGEPCDICESADLRAAPNERARRMRQRMYGERRARSLILEYFRVRYPDEFPHVYRRCLSEARKEIEDLQ